MAKRLALIIGNSEYNDEAIAQLRSPDVDADELARLFSDKGIGDFEVELALNKGTEEIRLFISKLFAKRRRDDLLLLYFSGHGILDTRGRLFIATKSTQIEFLSATAIPAAFICDEMNLSGSNRQVLILDCCHSGAFDRKAKGVLGTTVGTATAFEGNGYGRTILTATDATQYAWEGNRIFGEGYSSIFTKHLIEGIGTGNADLDNDGAISLDELYTYIYDKVLADKPDQTPSKWTYKQSGNIIIAKSVRPIKRPIESVVPDFSDVIIQENASSKIWKSPDGTVFREILSGAFIMGGNKYRDEMPVHKVFINSFFMATHPVTNGQFFRFCEETKYKGIHKNFLLHRRSFFSEEWRNDNMPVVFVDWQDAKEYILWRCEQDDRDYRLPTEAQWEYACRTGTRTVYYWGNEYIPALVNAGQKSPHPLRVCSYPPNPWGLYDMLGNVWEWCEDIKEVNHWEESVFYHHCARNKECVDPVNSDPNPMLSKTAKKDCRVIRGGSWFSETRNVRPANRRGQDQYMCGKSVGFRLVVIKVPQEEIALSPLELPKYLK